MVSLHDVSTRGSITRDLERLRARVRELNWRYPAMQFADPLEADYVRGIETELDTPLPSNYRAFLRHVASGGPGVHGLMSLRDACDLVAAAGSTPSAPFPYRWLTVAEMPVAVDGMLPLWDHGAGERSVLVLTGSFRGTVWRLWPRGCGPDWVQLSTAGREPHGFISWLEGVLGRY